MKKKMLVPLFMSICIGFSPALCYAASDYASEIAGNIPGCSDDELEVLISLMQDELERRQNNENGNSTEDDAGWIVKYYVDEFDLPTDDAYVTYSDLLNGSFSNSATSDSFLYAKLLIDESSTIMLYDYGEQQVKSYSDEKYNIIILDSSGNKTSVYGTMYENGDRIYIASSYYDTVLDVLGSGGEINFYVEEADSSVNNYLFTVPDSSNFDKVFNSLEF